MSNPQPHIARHNQGIVLREGPPVSEASFALLLLHGRGATAGEIMALGQSVAAPETAIVAPQAAERTWYPYSFLAPFADNEPHLSNALDRVEELVEELVNDGIAPQSIVVAGFSQGACLALEYVARRGKPLGAAIGWSGGLIGPPGTARAYSGRLDGMPVFLGCSDVDPHIPLDRVKETTTVLQNMGAMVDERIYPGMGHTVTVDEIRRAREIIVSLHE